MASPSIAQALRIPGTISVGPFTDITAAAASNGGTLLGLAQNVTLRWADISMAPLTAWEFGGEVVDDVRGGVGVMIVWRIRGADADAITAVFPNTFTSSGEWLREPGPVRAGAWASDEAVQVLFTPDDPTHPGLLLYEALPRVAAERGGEAALDMSAASEVTWLVSFVAARRPSDGRRLEWAPTSEMTAP